MRRNGRSRTIPYVRLIKTTPLWIPLGTLLGLAALLPGCASAPPQKPAPEPQTSAATVLAEIALKRGDCKGASESYARAAAESTAVSLARRASEVAVACEHLPAAWESVNRWRALAPGDREATALYATVALKLYRVPDARAAITEFSREKPVAGNARDSGLATLAALLLEHSDASAVLAAMGGALES
jgi:hypothetical protein